MLYELTLYDVITLKTACAVAQVRVAESAESAERCANNRDLTKDERDGAAWVAEWYQNQKVDFEAVCKALDKRRGITTMDQVKEALER